MVVKCCSLFVSSPLGPTVCFECERVVSGGEVIHLKLDQREVCVCMGVSVCGMAIISI